MSGLAREVGVAWETLEDDDGLFRLMECVHGPYCQLLVRYPAMETVLLKHKLHGVDMVRGGGNHEWWAIFGIPIPIVVSGGRSGGGCGSYEWVNSVGVPVCS